MFWGSLLATLIPIRYLGVPLISSHLRSIDCQILGDKIVARARSWTNKFLSYAGRLQLVKSILLATHTYWSSHFVLPKATLNHIERTLRNFLWRGSELKSGGAKVSWEDICVHQQCGGLGIPNLIIWN